MALTDFVIRNYRSVRDVWLKLGRINVIVGPNGTGKSNLYRAMNLVASTAGGMLARNIVEEGGMSSILWSGKTSKFDNRSHLKLSVIVDKFQYDITCGLVPPAQKIGAGMFRDNPEIKQEHIRLISGSKKSWLLERGRKEVKARSSDGQMIDYTMRVAGNESVLAGLKDPHMYPEMTALREEFLSWRFYHQFRTDRDSPLRKPQLAVFTELMANDGSDFVSALGTIVEMGDSEGLLESLDDAFPGSTIDFAESNSGLRLQFHTPFLQRPFEVWELSDGTLQYLCLLAALYSLRPPSLLAINEPETSIHPDLFEPLAKLLARASSESQIWITTHSRDLADYILEYSGCDAIELEKVDGETRLVGRGLGGYREDGGYREGEGEENEKFDFLDDEDDD